MVTLTINLNVVASLLVLLFFTLFARLCLYCWNHRRVWLLISKMPGPRAYPLIGNSLAFSGDFNEAFKMFNNYSRKYGPVVRLWFGPVPFVLISNKNDIQKILHQKSLISRGPYLKKAFKPLFLDGLFISEGEEWKFRRKVVQSTFHTNVFDQFVGTFAKNSELLVQTLKPHANGKALDITDHLGLCVLDIIFQTAFSYEFDAQIEFRSDVLHKMKKVLDILTLRFRNPLYLTDSIFYLTKHGKEFEELIAYFHRELSIHIDRRHNIYMELGRQSVDVEDVKFLQRTKPSLLDVMIATEQLSKQEMLGEVVTIAGAGGESTGATCCYAFCLLAEHQDIQAKVLEEQRMLFKDDFYRSVTLEDLPLMPYLDQVIKETMRLFPAAPHLIRLIEEEIELEDGNILPVGSYAYTIPYVSQRDPEFFPDPENFNPEHFSPENCAGRNPMAYLPFGTGRRICVAYKYSVMEIKVILSTVLRRYHFLETVGGIKNIVDTLEYGVVLRPSVGFNVKFVPRKPC